MLEKKKTYPHFPKAHSCKCCQCIHDYNSNLDLCHVNPAETVTKYNTIKKNQQHTDSSINSVKCTANRCTHSPKRSVPDTYVCQCAQKNMNMPTKPQKNIQLGYAPIPQHIHDPTATNTTRAI